MKLLVLLVATTAASPLEQAADSKAVAVEGAEAGANREGKLFSVFQIVQFQNEACTTMDGLIGSCYTAAECTTLGGGDGGPCAKGFGVCCKAVVNSCATTVAMNNSYIVNPGYPGELDVTETCEASQATNARSGLVNDNKAPRLFFPAEATTTTTTEATVAADVTATNPKSYVYTIKKASATVEQLRIDFIKFNIAPPEMGTCSNESLTITGADAVTMKVLPSNLCGVLTGQHVYLSVKDSEMVTITIKVTSDSTQEWELLVRQFEADQTEYLAPRGCLQYFKEDAASFSTFNNQGGSGELLNDHMYSVCIADNDAYCDVSLTASNFDLKIDGTECKDKVAIGTDVLCGSGVDKFGTSGSLLWNYTGAYQIPLFTDGDNTDMNMGFEISYILLPC